MSTSLTGIAPTALAAANAAAAMSIAGTSGATAASDGVPRAAPFEVSGRTVLVTGGGSGIGLALVEQFLKHNAKLVIITGRREEVLKAAQQNHPGVIEYVVSDAAKASDRVALFDTVATRWPQLSVLVNNAGISRSGSLVPDKADFWTEAEEEIAINFGAPVHLSKLFAPLLLKQPAGAAIIHITSGLAFSPYVLGPVYSATKAALHNFAIAQRINFEGSSVRVVEIVPPAVKTNFSGGMAFGEDVHQFADSVFIRWIAGEQEVGFTTSEDRRLASRQKLQDYANKIAEGTKAPKYQNLH